MYLQCWHGWCHKKLLPSRRILCTPYNHAPCHFMQSHIRKVYACLVVTCHLRFWQNDRGLLHATAVTQGWNRYRNKSQHRKSALENKILPPFQQGFQPATFWSRVRCSNHWAIPAPNNNTEGDDRYIVSVLEAVRSAGNSVTVFVRNTNSFILCVPAKCQSYSIYFWSLSHTQTHTPVFSGDKRFCYAQVLPAIALHLFHWWMWHDVSRQFGVGWYSVPFNKISVCYSSI